MFNEATALIDSAIAMFLDVQLYMMRIRSTYLAGGYRCRSGHGKERTEAD